MTDVVCQIFLYGKKRLREIHCGILQLFAFVKVEPESNRKER